jgi:hypothetical protein
MSKTAYTKYFNNEISHLTFLSENYNISLSKTKYNQKQFIEKIISNKEILKNYLKVNNIKLKVIITDISNEFFYKAIFNLK